MSQSQNFVTNGPSGDVTTDAKNSYEPVKIPQQIGKEVSHQPIYTPQQVDGSPRPPLLRIDSRSTLPPRPGFPNLLLRPQQPRPPPSGGTQFIQRPPPPPPQRPLGPGQNFYPQGQIPIRPPGQPPPPPNATQINLPRQFVSVGGANVGVKPGGVIPIQRPQGPPRPAGIFQQRSVPAPGTPRPVFNSYPTPRSNTLDSTGIIHNVDGADFPPSLEKHEMEKPALAAMKNRSFSVTGANVEPKPTPVMEDRRRSVSSVGNIEEEKRLPTNNSNILNGKAQNEDYLHRADSKTEIHMQKIVEDDDNVFTSNKSPLPKPFSSKINSNENTSQKFISNPSPIPPQNFINQQQQPPSKSPTPVPPPPIPQQKVVTMENETMLQRKPPLPPKEEMKQEKQERKSPELSRSKLKLFKSEGDNDSGVDESTQGNEPLSNGDQSSPKKSTKSSTPRSSTTPTKNRSFSRGAKSPNPKSPDTPTGSIPGGVEKKKVPMNKIQVGAAPSPNLKVVRSKIGSLQNSAHKPGGGNVKIENRKIDFSTTSSRIAAKNDAYMPGGGDKKIQQQKLEWNAKSKIGSLENTSHKPKGGDKKIESVKLDFKDKAKAKIGSKDNIKHVPGGGDVKTEPEQEDIKRDIENKKLDIKVQSKIGSLGNIKHKPGGGDKKIFDDKDYLRQMSAVSNTSLNGSQNSSQTDVREPVSDENLNRQR